jgi:O-antigen/teichoic acid export membrane protein
MSRLEQLTVARRRDGIVAQLAMLLGEMAIVFASGVLVYVLISRVSGPELLGHYALVLSWLTLFQAFAGFGVSEWVMREIGRAPEAGSAVGEALALGLASSVAASALMVGAASLWDYPHGLQRAIEIAALALPAFTVAQVCRGAFVARGRSQHVFAIRLLEFLAVVPANAVLIVRGFPVEALIATLVGGRMLGAVASLALLRMHGLRIAFPRRFPGLARLGTIAPFAASQALGLLATNLNLIMLSAWASSEVLGYYGGAAKLVDVLLLFPTVVGTFLLPRLAADPPRVAAGAAEPDGPKPEGGLQQPTLRRALAGLFAVAILACAGLALFAEWVLRTLYGPDLEPAAPILRCLMLYCALVVADAMTSVVLKATDCQRADAVMFAINPAVNAALNLALIPALGAVGAALAAVAAALSSLSLRYGFIRRRFGAPHWGALAAGPLAGAAVGAAAVFALRGHVPESALFAVWTAGSAWLLMRAVGARVGDLRRLWRAPTTEGSRT